jgi:hypothetical protein
MLHVASCCMSLCALCCNKCTFEIMTCSSMFVDRRFLCRISFALLWYLTMTVSVPFYSHNFRDTISVSLCVVCVGDEFFIQSFLIFLTMSVRIDTYLRLYHQYFIRVFLFFILEVAFRFLRTCYLCVAPMKKLSRVTICTLM